jgi:hypothetical protein
MGQEKGVEMGVYDSHVPEEVIKAVERMSKYPNEVSVALLKPVEMSIILDAGCGVATEIAQYCIGYKNAHYFGVDSAWAINSEGVKEPLVSIFHRKLMSVAGSRVCNQTSLRDFDLRTIGNRLLPELDVVHMRFVLMHLSPADRRLVLEQLAMLQPKVLVLVERDYSLFDPGTSKTHWVLKSFIETSLEFQQQVGADPYAGQSMETLAEELWPGKCMFKVFQQPAGEYWQDLLDLCLLQWSLAEQRSMKEFAVKFKESLTAFQFIQERDQALVFTPPALRTAVVEM